MPKALLPLLFLTGCVVADAPASAPPAGFVGQRLVWSHASGVGGDMVHRVDGTMTYDIRGETRTSRLSSQRSTSRTPRLLLATVRTSRVIEK